MPGSIVKKVRNFAIAWGIVAVVAAWGVISLLLYFQRTNQIDQQRAQSDMLSIQAIIGSWQWQQTQTGEETFVPNTPERFVLTFRDDMNLNSTTDCNHAFGPYAYDGTTLQVGPIASTQMYCEGSQEQIYLTQLDSIQGFSLEGSTLMLLTENDQIMIFDRTESAQNQR